MPFISTEFIERLLDDTSIEAIIQDFVELKKEGANLKGKSPFVEEKTASFVVSPRKQIWKCYSSGKGGNNALSFLMEKGLSYPEAIEYIAKKQGKSVVYEDTKQAKAYQEKIIKQQELRPILKATIKKYQEQFNLLPESHPAKNEVARRGYDQDIIDAYQIGYAPGNKFLYNILKETGNVEAGLEISLLTDFGNNQYNDFYYNRVTYTEFDCNGQPIGIVARDLIENSKIKWQKSRIPNKLYDNDQRPWYGLHIAKSQMRATRTAYIVEGCNDVIAFQKHQLLNTIGGNGTNIIDYQITALKKYVEMVIICLDGDLAGQKAALKNIKSFLEEGFRVYVINLPKGQDPDDFCRNDWPTIEKHYTNLKKLASKNEDLLEKEREREVEKWQNAIDTKNIVHYISEKIPSVDGFKLLLDQLKELDEISKSIEAKKLCELISKIQDESINIIYTQWLQKESKVPISTVKQWIKDFKDSRKETVKALVLKNNEYDFPKNVEPTEHILEDIKRYQMFMANNQIFTQATYEPPYKFRSCSNFSVFIIQHMRDENYPKKLVSAQNQVKESFVFDVPSDTFNVVGTFQKAMTNFGNFRWHGRSDDLQRLQALLFDKMGNGRSIDALGWQPEGFFLFNNLVIVPGDNTIDIDKNGCFKFKGIAYYVPSANVIYKDNHYKYMPQKRFRHIPGTITSLEYFDKMYRVHGNHAISSIFHAISCMFHDVVVKQLKGFPINFSYGPPGTGKDELNYAVKSLWGIPQEATNLEGGNSTATANIRELAQFNNGLMEWSEYARGDSKLDGTIKSIWDLRGKKIGTLDSRVATDNIPVLSGIALTGNEYPDNPAIITRIIWNDMNKTVFSEEDEKEFNEFNDVIDEGITHLTVKILNQRPLVEKTFSAQYRLLMDVYQRRIPDCNKRMLKNISTLTAFYNILKDEIDFPFTQTQILDHFTSITINQMRKLTSSSIVTRWWDCFIASMRGTLSDQILVGRDLKLEGPHLYFQFTNCYSKVQRQWFTQYRDSAPNKSTMKESIEKDSCYAGYKNVVDFNTGAPRVQSSAMYIDVMKLPGDLPDLIKAEVSRQEYELNKNPFSPAPPNSSENKNETKKDEELPF